LKNIKVSSRLAVFFANDAMAAAVVVFPVAQFFKKTIPVRPILFFAESLVFSASAP